MMIKTYEIHCVREYLFTVTPEAETEDQAIDFVYDIDFQPEDPTVVINGWATEIAEINEVKS